MSKITRLSHFTTDARELLSEIQQSGETLVLTQNGKASAIVQDIESYERQRNALLMLKLLATGESDIQKNKFKDHLEVIQSIKKKLHVND